MIKHTFRYCGTEEDRKVWIIRCKKTGGEFSSQLWDFDKVAKNVCPCCEQRINMENKN
mgnify:CR=1 FL=1